MTTTWTPNHTLKKGDRVLYRMHEATVVYAADDDAWVTILVDGYACSNYVRGDRCTPLGKARITVKP